MNVLYQDYRDAFLATLQGMVAKAGINIASSEHFGSLAANAHGVAMACARRLAQTQASGVLNQAPEPLSTGDDLRNANQGLVPLKAPDADTSDTAPEFHGLDTGEEATPEQIAELIEREG